jgi:hypothetical protein
MVYYGAFCWQQNCCLFLLSVGKKRASKKPFYSLADRFSIPAVRLLRFQRSQELDQ